MKTNSINKLIKSYPTYHPFTQMMNYSYKINDFALPEIPKKKILFYGKTSKSTYRSTRKKNGRVP